VIDINLKLHSETDIATMLTVTDLALDIILLILDHLHTWDLKPLRLTCKTFLHAVTPRLFSCVNVDIRKEFKFLFDLSSPLCTIAPHVTSLHIESLFFNNRVCTRSDAEKEALRVLSNQLAPTVLPKLRNLDTFK
jgi:hypothetical protein